MVSEKARFADTHVKVGVVAGDGGAVIWPLLIGPHRAKEFLMRGNFINGAEAGRIGMVNYAVAPDQVMTRAREIAQELADGPTFAIRWSKLSVNKWLKQQANLILDASLAYEMMTFKTEDHKEAVKAFVEKRKREFHQITSGENLACCRTSTRSGWRSSAVAFAADISEGLFRQRVQQQCLRGDGTRISPDA